MTGPSSARLRPVEPGDVAIFFEQQADPQAAAMAAHVVHHNVASLRVLERCGFVVVGEEQEPGDEATTIILRLS